MTIPLAVLAFGALFAGLIFKNKFIGEGMDAFWGHALAHGPDNHIMHDIHHVPALVSYAPFIMLVLGFVIAFWMYIRRPELPGALAAQQPSLYRFLLNKWYVDEIYDAIFVRPREEVRPVPLEGGRRPDHRRVRPERRRRPCRGRHPRGGPAPDRLRLPLRVRHAHRRRRPHQLVMMSVFPRVAH